MRPTPGDTKLLKLMKCDSMQGFLYAKPMSADDVEELVTSGLNSAGSQLPR